MNKHRTLSEEQTLEWAKSFASKLNAAGKIVFLKGKLGAGKTVLCRGICETLQCGSEVRSPSYALVNEYQGIIKVYHFDLYRLPENADWEEIGLDYYLNDKQSLSIIEWPERLSGYQAGFEADFEIEIKELTERPEGQTVREIIVKQT